MFKTTVGGSSWFQIDDYFDTGGALLTDPVDHNTIYAGGQRLLYPRVMAVSKSIDGGVNWQRYPISATEGMIHALTCDPTNPDTLYAGGWCYSGVQRIGKVYKSTDGGENWTDISVGLEISENFVQALAVRPDSPDTIFAGAIDGLFRSTNGGTNWNEIGSFDSVYAVVIDPDAPDNMYIGVFGAGVYQSLDGGETWQVMNDGLVSKWVEDLALDPDNDLLYAGTYYGGIFQTNIGESWDITGRLSYYSNDDPIDSALVATGSAYFDSTGCNGDYELLSLPSDNYVVRPEKLNAVHGAITAFDGAWILQYGIGRRNFTPYQMIAADVNGSGFVSAYDVALILQVGVGIRDCFPVMKDCDHWWRFVPTQFPITFTNWMIAPDSIAYTPLNSNMHDQNYVGIIYGDITGNWQSWCSSSVCTNKSLSEINISLDNISGQPGERITLPLLVDDGSDILSMSFTLEYDPKVLKTLSASTTELTEGWLMAFNIIEGVIKVALAGSEPVANTGAIVNLEFEVLENELSDVSSPLNISEIMINEGDIAVNVQTAEFNIDSPVPREYALSQNYPNPFNTQTVIKYQLPKSGRVVLKIYNTLGQEVKTLVDEEKKVGYHSINWDGKNNEGSAVSSGIYVYRIQAGDFVKVRKMLFVM